MNSTNSPSIMLLCRKISTRQYEGVLYIRIRNISNISSPCTSFPFFTNVGGGQPRIDEREREREKRNESSSTPLISTSQKEKREIFPPPKEFPSCSSRTHLLYWSWFPRKKIKKKWHTDECRRFPTFIGHASKKGEKSHPWDSFRGRRRVFSFSFSRALSFFLIPPSPFILSLAPAADGGGRKEWRTYRQRFPPNREKKKKSSKKGQRFPFSMWISTSHSPRIWIERSGCFVWLGGISVTVSPPILTPLLLLPPLAWTNPVSPSNGGEGEERECGPHFTKCTFPYRPAKVKKEKKKESGVFKIRVREIGASRRKNRKQEKPSEEGALKRKNREAAKSGVTIIVTPPPPLPPRPNSTTFETQEKRHKKCMF